MHDGIASVFMYTGINREEEEESLAIRRMQNVRKKYDVCIIGAGPASLSALSALQQPEGILKNDGMWSQWDLNKRKQSSSTMREFSICVIDPAGCWLNEWKGRFKSLGIETLRSPAWATPEYFESGSGLLEFAHKTDRESELHDIVLSKSATKLLHRQQDSGLWTLPGAKLFEDKLPLDPTVIPSTGAPVKGGLSLEEGKVARAIIEF